MIKTIKGKVNAFQTQRQRIGHQPFYVIVSYSGRKNMIPEGGTEAENTEHWKWPMCSKSK